MGEECPRKKECSVLSIWNLQEEPIWNQKTQVQFPTLHV